VNSDVNGILDESNGATKRLREPHIVHFCPELLGLITMWMARFLDPDVRLLFDDLNAHMAPRFRKLNHALAELVLQFFCVTCLFLGVRL
jgi:hypothetical protein